MRRTFHFSNGRGLEGSSCCCSLKNCALFHSVLFSLLSAVSLVVVLFAPVAIDAIGAVERISVCSLISISLLCSMVAPIGIYRRSCLFLAPFLTVLIALLALGITIITATVIYSIVEEDSLFRLIVDTALKSGLLNPIILFLFGPEALAHPSSFHRTTIFCFCLVIFSSIFFFIFQALVVTFVLWRRFFFKAYDTEAESMDWMFANLNGSYTSTLKKVPQYETREWRRPTYISMDDGLDSGY